MSENVEITKAAVDAVVSDALKLIQSASDLASLKAIRSTAVGENSGITKLSSLMGKLPGDKKADAGKLITAARAELNAAFTEAETTFYQAEQNQKLLEESVDVTAAPMTQVLGARHPLSLLHSSTSVIGIAHDCLLPILNTI